MAITTLTDDLREKILQVWTEHTFAEEKKEIKRMEYDLGTLIYSIMYSSVIQEVMNELPPSFFSQQDGITILYKGEYDFIHLPKKVPMSFEAVNQTVNFNFDETSCIDQVINGYLKLKDRKKSYKEKREQFFIQRKVFLESCETARQVVNAFPEIRPVFKQLDIVSSHVQNYFSLIMKELGDMFVMSPIMEPN